jgi:hypothetical protein
MILPIITLVTRVEKNAFAQFLSLQITSRAQRAFRRIAGDDVFFAGAFATVANR